MIKPVYPKNYLISNYWMFLVKKKKLKKQDGTKTTAFKELHQAATKFYIKKSV